MSNPPIGIYIHVPFCLAKCPYCDFYSVKHDNFTSDAYTNAVCRCLLQNIYVPRKVDSLYFGGGTPILLGAKNIAKIIKVTAKVFNFTDAEITIEANPAANTGDLLAQMHSAGCNRISFGVQSAMDNELMALGRLHSAQDAKSSILAAHEVGFARISADLMLGIPQQTRASLAQSVDFLTQLPLEHISAYLLKIEPSTPFYRRNTAALCPDDELVARLYLDCAQQLAQKGFAQYEISNFAYNNAVSHHNLKYWRQGEYLGIGPAAHSFMQGRRFYFSRDLDAFIASEHPFSLAVDDGDGGDFEEYAMLRLRLTEGLDLTEAAGLYGVDPAKILQKAKPLANAGLLAITGDCIALTPQGFLLSNQITGRLLL